jgi:hypothetical protein
VSAAGRALVVVELRMIEANGTKRQVISKLALLKNGFWYPSLILKWEAEYDIQK